uniref:Uncharacterized protein n=1 Tax=Eptatretus burgeri TaxID=7764 RepID=A0A8C4X0D5_EPTBU
PRTAAANGAAERTSLPPSLPSSLPPFLPPSLSVPSLIHSLVIILQRCFRLQLAKCAKQREQQRAATILQAWWRRLLFRRHFPSTFNVKIFCPAPHYLTLGGRTATAAQHLTASADYGSLLACLKVIETCCRLAPCCCEILSTARGISSILNVLMTTNCSNPGIRATSLTLRILLHIAKVTGAAICFPDH